MSTSYSVSREMILICLYFKICTVLSYRKARCIILILRSRGLNSIFFKRIHVLNQDAGQTKINYKTIFQSIRCLDLI